MPWGWWPAKNCLFNCYSPLELSNVSLLVQQRGQSRGGPCVYCTCLLALAGQLESVSGEAGPPAFQTQWENVFTTHAHGFSSAAGQCLAFVPLPALVSEWENATLLMLVSLSQGVAECGPGI